MADGLRVTWVGHATLLLELDGVRILTDPILGGRVGPLRRLGPSPDVAALGPIDAVLISHAHPDHFDAASVGRLAGAPLLVVPRGLGPGAARIGHPIREVAANERLDLGTVRVRALPARHARWPLRPGVRPLGYLIEGSTNVYFAGDTALYPEMARLAGHVEIALLPVGRWGPPRGPDRLDPATAVDVARLVGARTAIPIHWGTFHVPGFGTGRWGWGSIDAGDAFADEARLRAPQLDVRVLRPGDTTTVDPR